MKAEYLSHFGGDLMVVNAARVSHGKWKDDFDRSDEKLIRYLASHKHESPFFHPQIQFRLTAPIFVARQWFRHEVGFSRNEVSRRYVHDEPEFFTPDEWRAKPEGSIKQGSGGKLDEVSNTWNKARYEGAIEHSVAIYNELIDDGVAPEQARMVLPQSMMTQWIETGSLMAYARLCKLRLDSHAQKESRDLAKQVSGVMASLFPVSWVELMR